jgi:hypothetical protein
MGEDWTIRALKEYIDQRFTETNRALTKAEAALETRLEGMNQFRAQILTERADLLSKEEYETRHHALEQQLSGAEERIETRLAILERWQSKIIGAMALIIFLTPVLTALAVFYITDHHAP